MALCYCEHRFTLAPSKHDARLPRKYIVPRTALGFIRFALVVQVAATLFFLGPAASLVLLASFGRSVDAIFSRRRNTSFWIFQAIFINHILVHFTTIFN